MKESIEVFSFPAQRTSDAPDLKSKLLPIKTQSSSVRIAPQLSTVRHHQGHCMPLLPPDSCCLHPIDGRSWLKCIQSLSFPALQNDAIKSFTNDHYHETPSVSNNQGQPSVNMNKHIHKQPSKTITVSKNSNNKHQWMFLTKKPQ